MEEKNSTDKNPKKIEIKDFAEDKTQPDDEVIELASEDVAIDDETINETIDDEEKEKQDQLDSTLEDPQIENDEPEDDKEISVAEGDDNNNEGLDEESGKLPEISKPEDSDDKELELAVDDIVREEANDVLALEDAINEPEEPERSGVKKFTHSVKKGFSWWWHHTLLRNASLGLLMITILGVSFYPTTRYALLNMFGVRVSSSMRIIDSETSLPLQNISVSMQGVDIKTDENGDVSFSEMKLGRSELLIERRGYAESREFITLGLGSNPLGDKKIVATGLQYSFVLNDWITDASVTDASAISGEYTAKADEEGRVTITLGEDVEDTAPIQIKAGGYRDESFTLENLDIKTEKEVFLVNDRKHVFVSNRAEKFDIYTVDLDGKNETLLMEASGKERDIPVLYPHPSQQVWALIGSHEGEKNKDDYVLDGLYTVRTQTGEISKVARSERIQFVGWSGDYMVYWQVVEGTSQGNPERSKLFSYNFVTGERVELAAANYFNDVELVDTDVYYAVSGFAVPESYARLFKVNVNGEQKIQVLNKQVYSIFRVDSAELLYSAANQEWYSDKLLQGIEKTERRTSVPEDYSYITSPSGESVAWVRVRDGQGVLEYKTTLDDSSEGDVKEATVDAGIRQPLYWLGDGAVVYRVVKSGETADYIVSLQERPNSGDKISKITNITIQTFNGY